MDFSGNRISHISDNAISRFHELRSLNFMHNEISEIRRSMFPDPASTLLTLSLGHNKIKDFPEGMFRNMPVLFILDLRSNNIKWLSSAIFEPIYDEAIVLLEGNSLYCCGAQEWIVETKLRKKFTGTCYAPVSLAGKQINDLTKTDLRHGIC